MEIISTPARKTMWDYRVGRVLVTLVWRGFRARQRPYFSRHVMLAAFGAGPFGVMVKRIVPKVGVEPTSAGI